MNRTVAGKQQKSTGFLGVERWSNVHAKNASDFPMDSVVRFKRARRNTPHPERKTIWPSHDPSAGRFVRQRCSYRPLFDHENIVQRHELEMLRPRCLRSRFMSELFIRDAARARIASAVAGHHAELVWRDSKNRPIHPISVDDLLGCYMAIAGGSSVMVKTGSKTKTRTRFRPGWGGVKRTQKTYVFREKREVGFTRQRMAKKLGCPKAKATALMKTLLMLGLTEVEKNHSAGRHGIVYRIVPEGRKPKERPRPLPRPEPWVLKPIDPSDNPFADVKRNEDASDPFNISRDGSNIRNE